MAKADFPPNAGFGPSVENSTGSGPARCRRSNPSANLFTSLEFRLKNGKHAFVSHFSRCEVGAG